MKKEIIISKTNIHSIRNALLTNLVASTIKEDDYVEVDMSEVCTNEAHIILHEDNRTFTAKNTLKLIADELKVNVLGNNLKWTANNPNVVPTLSSSLFNFTVQDCVALYNILLNKKQTLKLDKNQTVVRDAFTKWLVQLCKDFYVVMDGKISLVLEHDRKDKDEYIICAIPSEKLYDKIQKSKKLSDFWNAEALDYFMVLKYKEGSKTAQFMAEGGNKTIDLNNDNFEYLMNIPGFHNYIEMYLNVISGHTIKY